MRRGNDPRETSAYNRGCLRVHCHSSDWSACLLKKNFLFSVAVRSASPEANWWALPAYGDGGGGLILES